MSFLQTGNLGRSSWITVAQGEIKGLRFFGVRDYWKYIGRILITGTRCRSGGSEYVEERWGDEGENDFEDTKVNVVLRS